MLHNFKTELENIDMDKKIKNCLKELYELEEDGSTNQNELPNLSKYEIIVEKYAPKN